MADSEPTKKEASPDAIIKNLVNAGYELVDENGNENNNLESQKMKAEEKTPEKKKEKKKPAKKTKKSGHAFQLITLPNLPIFHKNPAHVVVYGLQNAKKYNYNRAKTIQFLEDKGRFQTKVHSQDKTIDGKVLSVKPENLIFEFALFPKYVMKDVPPNFQMDRKGRRLLMKKSVEAFEVILEEYPFTCIPRFANDRKYQYQSYDASAHSDVSYKACKECFNKLDHDEDWRIAWLKKEKEVDKLFKDFGYQARQADIIKPYMAVGIAKWQKHRVLHDDTRVACLYLWYTKIARVKSDPNCGVYFDADFKCSIKTLRPLKYGERPTICIDHTRQTDI